MNSFLGNPQVKNRTYLHTLICPAFSLGPFCKVSVIFILQMIKTTHLICRLKFLIEVVHDRDDRIFLISLSNENALF